MSSLTSRLRAVVAPRDAMGQAASLGAPPPGSGELPTDASGVESSTLPPIPTHAADVLGGVWDDSYGSPFLIVERRYAPGYRHGHVAVADAMPPTSGSWPGLSLLAGEEYGRAGARLMFVDLETTGLAGGAGTYAFLVGCGWFDGGMFRVRQFFLSSFSAERALLTALAGVAENADAIVTYNGKTFDVPIIETRFVLHRLRTPFDRLPHLDMLHPARRLWKASDERSGAASRSPWDGEAGSPASCRLSVLEQTICGHVREGDVPGFEIPARYFHYVRSGDARPLAAVLEHNRLDLLSLALLTSHAAQLLDEGPAAARTAREALGLGRFYERAGHAALAGGCFARAEHLPGGTGTRAEALRALAVLSRRQRRYEDAACAWRRLLALDACPAPLRREATEALAIHHEHRLRDPHAAREFALQGLEYPVTPSRRQALHHRLSRLDRKLSQRAVEVTPLF